MQAFEELDRGSVQLLVGRDGLRVGDEKEVLTALLTWSISECQRRQLDTTPANQRAVLGDLIWTVRYWALPASLRAEAKAILSPLLTHDEAALLAAQLAAGPGRSRRYCTTIAGQSVSTTPTTPAGPTCRKNSCVTEKIFICLACIFE